MHKRDIYFKGRGFGGPAGFGPGGFGPPGFGPGGPGAFFMMREGRGGPGGPMRRRMRRGNVRAAILLLLEEEPRNGYQVMQEIEQRSEGAWRPSPGSVYPAFQLLSDEGLVRGEARDGGNVFELTDAGRSYVEENRERLGRPWERASEGVSDEVRELLHLTLQVGVASRQVFHAGTDAQRAEATKLLKETRRSLYRILAEDEPEEG
jgi:DNA-binding PadR family transcriptional regulator